MDPKDEIKQRLDIVDLVGEYVQLKPAGAARMKANCPFHQEKTPSFFVSRDKQIWHCFGCGEGGDIFSFVMRMEGIDFSEALRQLGEKVGVKIERFTSRDSNERARLLALLDLSYKFYNKILLEREQAKIAREYLARRGVTEELIKKFSLGYAPDAWDTLLTFLKQKGFSERESIAAGLCIPRQDQSGVYDRFRHRLMFPITDARGSVIGFTGRLLDESREEGKYINTPQTPVYNKSNVLYGFSLARQAIRQSDAVVVVEGNMDVIASHKAGVEAVVASSGTAFTIEQLALIRRLTDNILMCFDADPAGQTAVKRGIDLALAQGLNVRVVCLPGAAKDPDELIQKDSSAWKRAIAGATDVMNYYFDKVFASGSPKTAAEKKRVGSILLPEIARLQNPIERSHWLRELASRLGVGEAVLEETIEKLKSRDKIENREQRTENREQRTEKEVPTDRRAKLAEALLAVLFYKPDLQDTIFEAADPEDLPYPHRELYLSFVSSYHEESKQGQLKDAGFSAIFATFRKKVEEERPEHLTMLDRLALIGEEWYGELALKDLKAEVVKIVADLKQLALRASRAILQDEVSRAECAGDRERVAQLMQKFNDLR